MSVLRSLSKRIAAFPILGEQWRTMASKADVNVFNESGSKRVIVTKDLPGERWMQVLQNANCRVEICKQEDTILSNDIIKKLIGTKCDGVIGQLTEDWGDELFGALKAAGGTAYSNYAVGYNNVDVPAATKHGIPVGNTPGVLTETTAELAAALTLSAAHRVVEADVFMRGGQYKGWLPTLFVGLLLQNKTVGIIGAGRIGAAYARMLVEGYKMDLVYYDPYPNTRLEEYMKKYGDLLEAAGERRVTCKRLETVEEVLQQADVVSLHCNLDATTKHLINEQRLNLMKPAAVLVNAARGPVIDEKALVAHLKKHPQFRAGLDVFEDEPLMADRLAECPNAVIVPHIASASYWTRGGMTSFEEIMPRKGKLTKFGQQGENNPFERLKGKQTKFGQQGESSAFERLKDEVGEVSPQCSTLNPSLDSQLGRTEDSLVPVVITVLLLGLEGSGAYGFNFDNQKLENFLTDIYGCPNILGTGNQISTRHDIIYDVIHVQEVGRREEIIGWYHSHPGYGCWLSGIDCSTQMTWQQHSEPFLAIVVGPMRTMAAGKVEIGAFRTYPKDYKPPDAGLEYQTIPMEKIEDFGVHANQYCPLEISYFKSSLDNRLLDLLWNKYWVNVLAANPLTASKDFTANQIADVTNKLSEADQKLHRNPVILSMVLSSKQQENSNSSVLQQIVKDVSNLSTEQMKGLSSEINKNVLFNSYIKDNEQEQKPEPIEM